MERVNGIGRWFIRARNPEVLADWYKDHLGIEVTEGAESYPNRRFAQLRDPEGNPIELWEPVR